MPLTLSNGHHSLRGRKEINQDFHGIYVPEEPLLNSKGIAVALADGISSSDVAHVASEAAVTGFLSDYYCTAESWSVKKSAQRVLAALNSWLYSQTRQSPYRYDKDRGYVCTFSALIIKSATAHIFHVGDARVYRVQGNGLEQLTRDHRLWVSREKSYLSRALGIDPHIEIDYQALPLDPGDRFVLATDGVYEYADAAFIARTFAENPNDLDRAARAIVDEAYRRGSPDNLTIQLVAVESLPAQDHDDLRQQLCEHPFPPILSAGAGLDGYRILRELHASSRSHVYLAEDAESGDRVVVKTPSIDLRDDTAYLERFTLEDWIARRIDNPHVLKAGTPNKKRNFLYNITEYIEGRTLAQWMRDRPMPELESVRDIAEQIVKGLRAFHRLEMLHQDLRPDNIMIDGAGTVKIIDFGSTRVAGLMEIDSPLERPELLGTAAYTAPEYFLGESGTTRSDLFSLAVMTYQMLSGELPYGTQVAGCRNKAAQNRLNYRTLRQTRPDIPPWVDAAIRKAVHPDPNRRYGELTEWLYDLRHPNPAFLRQERPPLIERNPVMFWKVVSLVLGMIVIFLLLKTE